jgi:starch phosphorylase
MWFNKFKDFKNKPIAYFCAEYALFDHTALYAGGLGILSADYVKEMVKQKFPAVAIGLYYHKEHEHGLELTKERRTPTDLGLTLLKDTNGEVLKISIKINNRDVLAQVWNWNVNALNLYLLDTQVTENSPEDWNICDELYTDDRYTRLRQEIVLGIGGVKLINKLKITPSVFHLNEGHSAFMIFELIKREMINSDFNTACKIVRNKVVFTNHTLVDAGQERFDVELVKRTLENYSSEMNNLVSLGVSGDGMFSLTKLALNMSYKVNTVSEMHSIKARESWGDYRIENVTNGIYLDGWDLLRHYSNLESKRKLIKYINDKCGISFDENVLLLGWARRFVDYKRPLAILSDVDRLKKIGKVQIVFSSSVNSTYDDENSYVREIHRLSQNELKGIVAFIPNYDIEVARLLTSGCDVWLNTPEVGREACGTSGMKACLNGVLPLSTNDGWIYEVDLNGIGWKVSDGEITRNLLDTLERDIVPKYYHDKPSWKKMINNARKLILERFGTDRMLRDYIKKIYRPTITF